MNNKLEKTYNYIGFLICLSIPFMTYAKAFVNICMICLFLILVVLPNKQKFLEIIKNTFFKTFLTFLLFVTLFTVFNSSFFLDFSETRKIAQIALLFILFSFVNDKRLLLMNEDISNLEDADIAKLVTELQAKLVSRNAAQQSFIKIAQDNLFNYIR